MPRKSAKRRSPLRERVHRRIEELIIYGALSPGEHLVETELAAKLGVSRLPVREALQLLHRDGWVDLRPDLGAFVHTPTFDEVEDTFAVRTLLETASAELAALNADEDSVRPLIKILEEGTKASRVADEKKLVKLNSDFHSAITHLAGNKVLESLIARLDKGIRWYFSSVARVRGSESWKEHADIVDAIRSHDPKRAANAMHNHTELTRQTYHEYRVAHGQHRAEDTA